MVVILSRRTVWIEEFERGCEDGVLERYFKNKK